MSSQRNRPASTPGKDTSAAVFPWEGADFPWKSRADPWNNVGFPWNRQDFPWKGAAVPWLGTVFPWKILAFPWIGSAFPWKDGPGARPLRFLRYFANGRPYSAYGYGRMGWTGDALPDCIPMELAHGARSISSGGSLLEDCVQLTEVADGAPGLGGEAPRPVPA